MTEPWWISAIEAFVIINLVLLAFAYTTLLERKVLARMQPLWAKLGEKTRMDRL